jgi:hypothetical protein
LPNRVVRPLTLNRAFAGSLSTRAGIVNFSVPRQLYRRASVALSSGPSRLQVPTPEFVSWMVTTLFEACVEGAATPGARSRAATEASPVMAMIGARTAGILA